MSQSEASAQILERIHIGDAEAAKRARQIEMYSWRQRAGIAREVVRIDFRLDQPIDTIMESLEAFAGMIRDTIKSARKLDDPGMQASLIASMLDRERLSRKVKGRKGE